MLKKILLGSAIAATGLNVALADPSPYVGASLGILNNSSNVKVVTTNVTSVDNTVAQMSTIYGGSFRGMPFNLFAGYGGVINQNFYLAGELSVTAFTANLSNDTSYLKTSYGYGASIVPGLMLSDHTLAYGRLGVVRARFTDNNQTRTGAQFGLGLQTCLTQNIDLRGEYDYIAYQSTSYAGAQSDQFTVGVIYKFD